jgi:hypothetical protein
MMIEKYTKVDTSRTPAGGLQSRESEDLPLSDDECKFIRQKLLTKIIQNYTDK